MSIENFDLNLAQQEAVEYEGGQLMILAGPGSGKTRVIANKITHLIQNKNIHPSNIFAATFTKKAANEMQERVEVLIQKKRSGLNIGTFHSLCALILRKYGKHININNNFTIYDGDDQRSLIKTILIEENLNTQIYNPYKIINKISKNKNKKLTNQLIEEFQPSAYERKINEIAYKYQNSLTKNNALDFDDLLIYCYQLLLSSENIRKDISSKYHHVLIDEFQDTNLLQYEISKLLSSVHKNITVVGDPDQSIYSWRSAQIENLTKFQNDHPLHKLVLLEQNYRSTKSILEVASNIIQNSTDRIQREIWTNNKIGDAVEFQNFEQGEDEGDYIAKTIIDYAKSQKAEPKDIAIMYRTNAQSRIIEEALLVKNIQYKIVGGLRFYERKEIKDILAYLRILQNKNDSVAFTRIINTPTRGIGKESLSRLIKYADESNHLLIEEIRLQITNNTAENLTKKEPLWKIRTKTLNGLKEFLNIYDALQQSVSEQSIAQTIESVMKLTNYKNTVLNQDAMTIEQQNSKIENINELISIAQEYDTKGSDEPLVEFLHDLSLVADVSDVKEEETNAITLTTLHSAKGLEFPIVFLPGVEEGLLPHMMSLDSKDDIEEERRILYVGVTRAKIKLYISSAKNRFIAGSSRSAKPSRFLDPFTKTMKSSPSMSHKDNYHKNFIAERKKILIQKREEHFISGMKVNHNIFGAGIIISIEERSDDQQLTIAFKEKGLKKLLASHAPLEIISG
jgi:DNA helicase-2/ATP-dependent DNA helicase PcrA